jgi:hypothetical protein
MMKPLAKWCRRSKVLLLLVGGVLVAGFPLDGLSQKL